MKKRTAQLENLFKPAAIGKVQIRNRIVMAPMTTNFATKRGEVTERTKVYYEERSKGGAGLITVGGGNLDARSKVYPFQLGIYGDRLIPGLRELTNAIHIHGAKVCIQMDHFAGRAPLKIDEDRVVKPSYAPKEWPGELTDKAVKSIMEDYVRGAIRAQEAGFDLVELLCAHGSLLEQFLSRETNKRTDEYGGDLEGRVNIVRQIIKSIKTNLGKGFPIICRISGVLPMEDTNEIAQILEKGGADGLHVTESPSSRMVSIPPMAIPRGCFVPLSESIKKVVSIPVICVGRINDPILAEEILRENKADFVAMARALLADPELPNKAAKGDLDDIRKCIACLQGCFDRLQAGLPISCTQNASVGKEKEHKIRVTEAPKKVIIVGGGPGGLEAARVAALRGHEVTLYERGSELGGLLPVAAKPPYKDEMRNVIEYLTYQIEKLGINVELRKELTSEMIREMNPDVVIVATGAIPIEPRVEGVEGGNVLSAVDVLAGNGKIGEQVIVVGGGFIGCETAEYLSEKGKKVTIIEATDRIGTGMGPIHRMFLMGRLRGHGVNMVPKSEITELTDGGAIILEAEGERKLIKADTIVLAVGMRPNNDIFKELEGEISELYAIGDCVEPRRTFEAIHEGAEISRKI